MQTRSWLPVMATVVSLTIVTSSLGAQRADAVSIPADLPVAMIATMPTTPSAALATAGTSAMVLGPHRDAAVAGVRLRAIDGEAASLVYGRPLVAKPGQVKRGTSLGLLGLAAFVAGLAIGEDVGTVMAVGGAVVGIYGLYLILP